MVLKRSSAGEVRNVSVLVAAGVGADGYRTIGIAEGHKEEISGRIGFLRHRKEQRLKGAQLVISDACLGLKESVAHYYPEADWRRCVVHCYRNVFNHAPNAKIKEVARMFKAIHAQESLQAARSKATRDVDPSA